MTIRLTTLRISCVAKITKNFSLKEFTNSQSATRLGIANQPETEHLINICALANNILQPVREQFGIVTISSGYRSPELNSHPSINGSNKSQHCKGQASDFECFSVSNLELAEWIKNNLDFDQLILEFYDPEEGPNSGWIHCSYNISGNRKQVLTAKRIDGKVKYEEGLCP